jgi:hypothetical protein
MPRTPRAAPSALVAMSSASSPRRRIEGCPLLSMCHTGHVAEPLTSTRQVQDLEKQLLVAKQQVSHYQSLVKGDSAAVDEDDSSPGGSSPAKRRKLERQNYGSIQTRMIQRGSGLLRAPTAEEDSSRLLSSSEVPAIPSRDVADHLLHKYETSVQSTLPFLNWPKLMQLVDRIYQDAYMRDVSVDSLALFFGCLACGALLDGVEEARPHFESMRKLLDLWAEHPSVNLVRAAVLGAFFLVESNQRRRAFALIGYAVRIAQDVGLHRQTGMLSLQEEDFRYRLWSVLVWIER